MDGHLTDASRRSVQVRPARVASVTPWTTLLVSTLALALALVLMPIAQEIAAAEEQPPAATTVTTQGTGPGELVKQVERVSLGSQSATVTLEGGDTFVVDFSDLAGGSGGPNYLGWGMLLFGASVGMRLLSTFLRLARSLRPRGGSGRL